mmetsp:Transcript_49214/g.160003  ORF Transcript_49214/g.160003 Transcript_49214/m.160003 type:complete len:394 (+) Transcript_49214:15-1196(+)
MGWRRASESAFTNSGRRLPPVTESLPEPSAGTVMQKAATKLQAATRGSFSRAEASWRTTIALVSAPVGSNEVEWASLGPMKRLGAGEFCVASACSLDGAPCAVKTLRPEKEKVEVAVADLLRESSLLSRLHHPHIIRALGFGTRPAAGSQAGGALVPFLCLELLSASLSSSLPPDAFTATALARKRGVKAWPVRRAIDVGRQIASALRHCHDGFLPNYRLLHRDLKPDNVGFASDGRAVLLDFGLCKLWQVSKRRDGPSDGRKMTGQTGSLRYMAPEVALCKPYDHTADVFSWASLLYEMAAHKKPYYAMDAQAYISQVCNGGHRCELPAAIKAIPDVAALLSACWSTSPSQRPDFAQVVPVLEAALAALPAAADAQQEGVAGAKEGCSCVLA